jgi:hypothetical protein
MRGLSQPSIGPLSPVMSSTPAVWTHDAYSSHLSSPLPTTLLAHTLAGCGHGGTREPNTSRSDHTWSVTPAAIACVRGRHTLVEPPLVASAMGSAWRKLAWAGTML